MRLETGATEKWRYACNYYPFNYKIRKMLDQEQFSSVNEFINEIIERIKKNETAVFCGAGISFYSGLPLANELVQYLLKKIGVSQKQIETVVNSDLPFEAFIEILRGSSDLSRLYDIFEIGEPNINHFLLARLAKAGYLSTICTTNFDRLLERAFEREGLVRRDNYQVFYKEHDFEGIEWPENTIRLIKLHGSVEDKNNMAITLAQVASRILSEQRKRALDYIFSNGMHKNVLVLGYSCSDIFDISPQIDAIRDNCKEVFLVDHNKSERAIKEISEKKEKNPFRHFAAGKWILYDTDELIKALWNSYFRNDNCPIVETSSNTTLWQNHVDDWFIETEHKYTAASKYNLAGDILFRISEYEDANTYYEQSVSIAREIGDKPNEGIWLGNLGGVYEALGAYHKSIEYHQQALRIAEDIGDKKNEGKCLSSLGDVYYDLAEYKKALAYHKAALKIERDTGDKYGEEECLGRMANVYYRLCDYPKAIEYYKQSIEISRELGNKRSEKSNMGGLGNVYLSFGDYQNSIKYFEQAIKCDREIGDKLNEAIGLNNLGIVYGTIGEKEKAKRLHNEALIISREVGDKQNEGKCLGNLGNIYDSVGDYKKAMTYFEQALNIARKIGDKQSEGTWNNNIGFIYGRLGEYQEAILYFHQALRIAEEIGDKKGGGLYSGNLGNVYDSVGDYKKAMTYFEQALNDANEIGDKENEGGWLYSMGNTHFRQGNPEKALTYFKRALSVLNPILGRNNEYVVGIKKNIELLNEIANTNN